LSDCRRLEKHANPLRTQNRQARILKYDGEIGWTVVSRHKAEQRRGFNPNTGLKNRAKGASLFFDELLDAKLCEFNPQYSDDPGELQRKFAHFQPNIEGNRKFLEHLRNKWASCSTKGHLNFNSELLGFDQDVWDYVIVHELLHFFVPNHGR